MSAMSVVFSVFVLNFHHKTTAASPPPGWIKGVALIASYITCSKVRFSDTFQSASVNEYTVGHSYTEQSTTQPLFSECQINSFEDTDVCQSLLQRQTDQKRHMCNSGNCNGTVIIPDPQSSGSKTSTVLEKVMLDYVTKVLSSYDKKAHESRTIEDWREIARVVDRLFFILFLFITLVSTFVILIVCPLMKDITIDNELAKE